MSELTPLTDGRRMRSERSRTAIIEAALNLISDGVLVPTAQQISDRSGVGMRTFFRHFEDMESLFAAVDESSRASFESLFVLGEPDGSLSERVEHAIDKYSKAYEELKNIALSTHAQLWRSKVLVKNYALHQRKLRKNLDTWIPELKSLSSDKREAVFAVTSFDMWHRLRTHQGLSKKVSKELILNLFTGILRPKD